MRRSRQASDRRVPSLRRTFRKQEHLMIAAGGKLNDVLGEKGLAERVMNLL
jgi:hypothetical protein